MLNDRMDMNIELGRLYKEMILGYFRFLSQHLSQATEGNHKRNLSQDLDVNANFCTAPLDFIPVKSVSL